MILLKAADTWSLASGGLPHDSVRWPSTSIKPTRIAEGPGRFSGSAKRPSSWLMAACAMAVGVREADLGAHGPAPPSLQPSGGIRRKMCAATVATKIHLSPSCTSEDSATFIICVFFLRCGTRSLASKRKNCNRAAPKPEQRGRFCDGASTSD